MYNSLWALIHTHSSNPRQLKAPPEFIGYLRYVHPCWTRLLVNWLGSWRVLHDLDAGTCVRYRAIRHTSLSHCWLSADCSTRRAHQPRSDDDYSICVLLVRLLWNVENYICHLKTMITSALLFDALAEYLLLACQRTSSRAGHYVRWLTRFLK